MSNPLAGGIRSLSDRHFLSPSDLSIIPYQYFGDGVYGMVMYRRDKASVKKCRCIINNEDITKQLKGAAGFESYTVEFIEQVNGDWLVAFKSESILSSLYGKLTAEIMLSLLQASGLDT